jgi:hypothetical protein
MKKTKKEKILADLRKKQIILENQFAYKVEPSATSVTQNYQIKAKTSVKSATLAIDYMQIAFELKKTLLISLLVISLLLVGKFFLKL